MFDIVSVLPTHFGKSLLFQLLPHFLSVKADNNIMSNGLTSLHDSATVCDIQSFSVWSPISSFTSLVIMKGTYAVL